MSLLSRFTRSRPLNALRGIYHKLQYRIDAPPGLTISGQTAWKVQRLVEKLRPIATEHQLIRIGPGADGGYLVPDDLAGITACYSPGVSDTIGFDLDCAQRGMEVFLADASVDGLPVQHHRFAFTGKYLACWEDETHTTLDAWVRSTQPDGSTDDLMLQMDIEGSEYQVLASVSDAVLAMFRIIVIEFHWLDHLWNQGFLNLVAPIFNRLLRSHYCVHLHPNNCCGSLVRGGLEIPRVMEFTFLRKDRVTAPQAAPSLYPHPLDADNTARPPLALPECWWNPVPQPPSANSSS
ncbi:MAG: FkbM family methyltransferase [Cyanobacteria bacterium J06638_7]